MIEVLGLSGDQVGLLSSQLIQASLHLKKHHKANRSPRLTFLQLTSYVKDHQTHLVYRRALDQDSSLIPSGSKDLYEEIELKNKILFSSLIKIVDRLLTAEIKAGIEKKEGLDLLKAIIQYVNGFNEEQFDVLMNEGSSVQGSDSQLSKEELRQYLTHPDSLAPYFNALQYKANEIFKWVNVLDVELVGLSLPSELTRQSTGLNSELNEEEYHLRRLNIRKGSIFLPAFLAIIRGFSHGIDDYHHVPISKEMNQQINEYIKVQFNSDYDEILMESDSVRLLTQWLLVEDNQSFREFIIACLTNDKVQIQEKVKAFLQSPHLFDTKKKPAVAFVFHAALKALMLKGEQSDFQQLLALFTNQNILSTKDLIGNQLYQAIDEDETEAADPRERLDSRYLFIQAQRSGAGEQETTLTWLWESVFSSFKKQEDQSILLESSLYSSYLLEQNDVKSLKWYKEKFLKLDTYYQRKGEKGQAIFIKKMRASWLGLRDYGGGPYEAMNQYNVIKMAWNLQGENLDLQLVNWIKSEFLNDHSFELCELLVDLTMRISDRSYLTQALNQLLTLNHLEQMKESYVFSRLIAMAVIHNDLDTLNMIWNQLSEQLGAEENKEVFIAIRKRMLVDSTWAYQKAIQDGNVNIVRWIDLKVKALPVEEKWGHFGYQCDLLYGLDQFSPKESKQNPSINAVISGKMEMLNMIHSKIKELIFFLETQGKADPPFNRMVASDTLADLSEHSSPDQRRAGILSQLKQDSEQISRLGCLGGIPVFYNNPIFIEQVGQRDQGEAQDLLFKERFLKAALTTAIDLNHTTLLDLVWNSVKTNWGLLEERAEFLSTIPSPAFYFYRLFISCVMQCNNHQNIDQLFDEFEALAQEIAKNNLVLGVQTGASVSRVKVLNISVLEAVSKEGTDTLQKLEKLNLVWADAFNKIEQTLVVQFVKNNAVAKLGSDHLEAILTWARQRQQEWMSLDAVQRVDQFEPITNLNRMKRKYPDDLGSCANPRRKRDVEVECLFSLEDLRSFSDHIEEFDPDNLKTLRIRSEKFIEAIQNSPEKKRFQLIQLASQAQIVGSAQNQIHQLIRQQKIQLYFDQVGQIAHWGMHGIIGKDIIADFLRGDYQDVAMNVNFLAGGALFLRLSEISAIKGSLLAQNEKVLLGRLLEMSSPFIKRFTLSFIAYDLVRQAKEWKAGDTEAWISVAGDSVYVSIDVAELGIEVAEMAGLFEDLSAFSGPVGMALGAVVMVGMQIYAAVKQVNHIEKFVRLSHVERFLEGLRAFIGMRPEKEIQELVAIGQSYQQVMAEELRFLAGHHNISHYVTAMLNPIERCQMRVQRIEICERGGRINHDCVIGTGIYYTERQNQCSTEFEVEQNSTVLLNRFKADVHWGRFQDMRWGRLQSDQIGVFCLPSENEAVVQENSYYCSKAFGMAELSSSSRYYTLIALGTGYDSAFTFDDRPTIFIVREGFKKFYGGQKDDVFQLQGEAIEGDIDGGGGNNTLDCSGFALTQKQVKINLNDHYLSYGNRSNPLGLFEIQIVYGRARKSDYIEAGCDTYYLDGQGGENSTRLEDWDTMLIPAAQISNGTDCFYRLSLVLRASTRVNQQALQGRFDYIFMAGAEGEAIVDLKANASETHHHFLFNYTLFDLRRIEFPYLLVHQNSSMQGKYGVKFHFLTSECIQADYAFIEHLDYLQFVKKPLEQNVTLILGMKSPKDGGKTLALHLPIPLTVYQIVLAVYPTVSAPIFNVSFTQADEMFQIYRQLVMYYPLSRLQDLGRVLTVWNPWGAIYHLQDGTEIKLGQKNRFYALKSTNESLSTILKFYPMAAQRLNMSLFIQRPQEVVAIGQGDHEILFSYPEYASHLMGNGGENTYVVAVGETRDELFQLPGITLYHFRSDQNMSDTLDLRELMQRIRSNTTLAQVEIQPDQRQSLQLIVRSNHHKYVVVRLENAFINAWYTRLKVVLNYAPLSITLKGRQWRLTPLPIVLDEGDKQVILVTSNDVELGTELQLSQQANQLIWASWGQHLILSNAFYPGIDHLERRTLVLHHFYTDRILHTLTLQLSDQRIVLQDRMKEINLLPPLAHILKYYAEMNHTAIASVAQMRGFHQNQSSILVEIADEIGNRTNRSNRFKREWDEHDFPPISSSASRPVSWIDQTTLRSQKIMSAGWQWVQNQLFSGRDRSRPYSSQLTLRVHSSDTDPILAQREREIGLGIAIEQEGEGIDEIMEQAFCYMDQYDQRNHKPSKQTSQKIKHKTEQIDLQHRVQKKTSYWAHLHKVDKAMQPREALAQKTGCRLEKIVLPKKEIKLLSQSTFTQPDISSFHRKEMRAYSPEFCSTQQTTRFLGIEAKARGINHASAHRIHQDYFFHSRRLRDQGKSYHRYERPLRVTASVDMTSTLFACNVLARVITHQKYHSTPALPKKIQKGLDQVEKMRLESSGIKIGGKINHTFYMEHSP